MKFGQRTATIESGGRVCSWLGGAIGGGIALLMLAGQIAGAAEAEKIQAIAIRPIDPTAALKVSYHRDVRPILADHCIECHGADEPKGGYRMTSVAELLKSGKKNGPGVIPGKPDESPVVRYVRGELKPQMPKGNPVLSSDALHTIRQWIAAGAPDDTAERVALITNENEAWEQFDPRKQATIAKARLTSAAMDALLDPGADLEKRFLARRQWRLTQLPVQPVPPGVKAPVFNAVDKFIATKWEAKGFTAPAVCDDEAFVRRVYLDIIGVVPTVLEAQQFLTDTNSNRRARLIDGLLARSEDYACHWTTFWEDIIASADASIRGGILTRGNHKLWIENSLLRNKPYDLMVAELIDTSLPNARKPTEQKSFEQTFKVGYVRNDSVPVTLETAANVGQVFLGTSMKCATCHTHFENPEWPQAKFIAFASVFATKDLELVRCEKRSGTFIAAAFPFEITGAPKGLPEAIDERLRRAAQLVTDPLNPRFAKAFVNRIWKKSFGLGLVEPVDEFRADRPASHPELLEWLAQEFMRSGYDIKQLLRLILNSRSYQLAYDPKAADAFDSTRPDAPRYFRSPQLRRMSAEQLLDSLNVVGTQQSISARRVMFRKDATVLTQALGRPASRSEVITTRSEEMAVIQFLEMVNGSEYQSQVYRSPLLDLLAVEDNGGVAAESLYLAALTRKPSAAEVNALGGWLQPALQKTKDAKTLTEELVLFDDDLLDIFTPLATTDYVPWGWGAKDIQPVFSGKFSIRNQGGAKVQWQGAGFAPDIAVVNMNESLFAQVYLEPKNPPKSIWLRVQQEEADHQAVWTSNAVTKPQDPMLIMVYGGELPKAGGWVRLQMPFRRMQLVNGPIKSISFGAAGGTAYWDSIGLLRSARSSRVQPLGDVLWALVTSPEFQYIR
jgi:mono/diheme cytochrome c family protein